VCPITTCVAIIPDCPARSRHNAEACAAAHRSIGRVRTPAEEIGNRPKRRHRQLFLGLFKVVGVYHGGGGGDAAARNSRPLPLADILEGGGEVDRAALAKNSSTSNSRSRIKPYKPLLRRWTTVPTFIGRLVTSGSPLSRVPECLLVNRQVEIVPSGAL
jgi:hypothetical protein